MYSYILYVFVAILTIIFLNLFLKINGIFKYIFFILACLVPTLLGGLREGVGTDYEIYQFIFFKMKESISSPIFNNFHGYDPFFILITRLIAYFGNFRLFLIVTSFLIVFCHIYSFYRISIIYKLDFLFLVFLFLIGPYLTSFNIIAQFIATSFGLLSFVSKKTFYSILFLLLSLLSHFTGIIFLILVINKLVKNFPLKIFSFIFFIISFFPESLFNFVASLNLPIPQDYFSPTLNIGNNFEFYLQSLYILLFLYFYKVILKLKLDLVFFINFISLAFINLGFYNIYIKRLYLHFSSFAGVSFLKTTKSFRFELINKSLSFLIIIYFLVLSYVGMVMLGQSDLVPYRFSIL